jgi:magnesium chelatase family protein
MTYAMQRAGAVSRGFILPRANADEAALVEDAIVLPADSLLAVCAHFAAGEEERRLRRHVGIGGSQPPVYPDLSDVKGQAQARRALEVAAAGTHSLLMIGPPGSGKSMLAARLPGILPPMTENEALESAALQSLIGSFDVRRWKQRPIRAPHHTASAVALVGGSSNVRPGEISLAHCGVLFLDELPEFERKVLEVLREPMESGRIMISRAARQAEFPARFQLLAAMNPCPCGYFGVQNGKCRCSPEMVARYQGRISGPLLDRIDLQLEVGALQQEELLAPGCGESSASVAQRVARAAARQLERQGKSNAALSSAEVERHCTLDAPASALLRNAMTRLGWSARAYHRVLKVARSIADLAGADCIGEAAVAEAVQYRRSMGKP